MRCLTLVFCFAALAGLGPALNAADLDLTNGILVDSTADAVDVNPGDGICASAAGACTLRAAVQEANLHPGADTIRLPAGIYTLTLAGGAEDLGATGDLDILDSLTLNGDGAASTVIDGNGTATGDRVIHVLDPSGLGVNVALNGITVRGGRVLNENGGGILASAPEGGGPLRAVPGNAAAAETGGVSLTLTLCTVTGNAALSDQIDPGTGKPVGGAGAGVASEGALTVLQSSIHSNQAATNGGGIYSAASLILRKSTVRDNSAEGGGGLFDTGSHATEITDSTFSGNQATGGGAISSRPMVTITLTNSTIHDNHATDVGSGITTNGTVIVRSSTISGNVSSTDAPFGGAGLNVFARGGFTLSSSVLAENLVGTRPANCGCTGGSCTGGFTSLGNNVEDADTCGLGLASDHPVMIPALGPLRDNGGPTFTRELTAASPAMDLGGTCPAVDQRGVIRPVDGDGNGTPVCDPGAYERCNLSFLDVPTGYWAESFITTMACFGITSGCGGGGFCPHDMVTRAQVAVFLLRALHGATYVPPPATGTVFFDIPADHWAARWIEQFYREGRTAGCGGGMFCPDQLATRAEMAIFLLQGEHGTSYQPPPATGTLFSDVPAGYWAAAWIERIYAEGITAGCGTGVFCPDSLTPRDQMAVFVAQTFGLHQ